jgi:2,5-diketo-D-gluconate reductase A
VSDVPNVKLNDGNEIPQLGLGVYQLDPSDTEKTVSLALEIGYRHIDTAQMYKNEAEVGSAVAASGLDRGGIFLTSKLNNSFHKPDDAKRAFNETLEKLKTDYIDLFLIHWPLPSLYDGDYVATWKVLESFKKDGLAKSVGVSNFNVVHLEKLAENCELKPSINQIELHPYFQNQEVASYDSTHDIATESWSPIAQGDVLDDPIISTIADEVGKTAAQVVLRWHIQLGYIVFPKSATPERIKENFDIFDFELTSEQMEKIKQLNKGKSGRRGPDPDTFDYIP